MPVHSHRFDRLYIRSRQRLPPRVCEPALRPHPHIPLPCNSADHHCGDNEQAERDNRESPLPSSSATLHRDSLLHKYSGTRNLMSRVQLTARSIRWESKSICAPVVRLPVVLIHKHHDQALQGCRGKENRTC